MKIKGKTLCELLGLVYDGLERLKDERGSGYIAIYDDAGEGGAIAVCKVNICQPDKALRYFTLSQEKAHRLSCYPNDVASFQSRRKAEDKWGGAIRAGNVILSFSGLTTELADEALMIYVAYKAGWITTVGAFNLAEISGNRLVTEDFLGYKRQPLKC